MHPLAWIVSPAVVLIFGVELVGHARTGAWGGSMSKRWLRVLAMTIAVLMFAVWIARFVGAFGGPVRVD
jgi:hypothetical protein